MTKKPKTIMDCETFEEMEREFPEFFERADQFASTGSDIITHETERGRRTINSIPQSDFDELDDQD